jgi:hypothetical protein
MVHILEYRQFPKLVYFIFLPVMKVYEGIEVYLISFLVTVLDVCVYLHAPPLLAALKETSALIWETVWGPMSSLEALKNI